MRKQGKARLTLQFSAQHIGWIYSQAFEKNMSNSEFLELVINEYMTLKRIQEEEYKLELKQRENLKSYETVKT